MILFVIFDLLHNVSKNSAANLMTSTNLTIVWSPNFIKGKDPVSDLKMCAIGDKNGGVGTIVKKCIEEYDMVFFNSMSYLHGTDSSTASSESHPVN